MDEAGRGPLAGPGVAAACIFPEDLVIEAINDSKQMTEEDREEVFEVGLWLEIKFARSSVHTQVDA